MLNINRKDMHKYVACLDDKTEQQIRTEVVNALKGSPMLTTENVHNAMCSKVCDLEDTININYVDTYKYYEDGQNKVFTTTELREHFDTCEGLKEQKQQGTTFDDWIAELIKMQILVRM